MRRPRRVVMAPMMGAALVASACSSAPTTPAPPQTVTVTASPSSSMATSGPITSVPVAAPTPTDLKSAYEAVRGSVVRVQTATCELYGQGSGFVAGDRFVVTAAHVITDAQATRVILGTTTHNATVVGKDDGTDVAVLRTDSALNGPALTLTERDPAVGDEVAGIGYTLGDPLSLKPGRVNGLGRKVVIDGIPRHSLIEFDAATNHGNSGGPVIDTRGDVVGIVDAGPEGEPGLRLAVSARVAGPLVRGWIRRPRPVAPDNCPGLPGPGGSTVPVNLSPTSSIRQALQTLDLYFSSINNGDFPTAVAQMAAPMSVEKFTAAVTSSSDRDVEVLDAHVVAGRPVVWLTFTSVQAPGQGPRERISETCTVWSQNYHFVQRRGVWLIDKTSARPGAPRNRPCD